MKTFLLLAGAAAISGAAMIGSAAAMPAAKLDANAQPAAANSIQNVHWVCGPYRCWWRPNYYNYYGPRRYYRRWWW